MATKRSYYVHATSEDGSTGERPEIQATSKAEAERIYRELAGDRYPNISVELKKNIDADDEQVTKDTAPVNVQEDSGA